jgi:hypothetical protein
MLISFTYYSYYILIFYFSILGLIFIFDEFLAVVFGTKPGFCLNRILYLDYPLLDYFRNLLFSLIFLSNSNDSLLYVQLNIFFLKQFGVIIVV